MPPMQRACTASFLIMSEVAFDVLGKGSRKAVGLHGLGADRSQLIGLLPAHMQTILPDLRGHGATTLAEHPSLLTIGQLAADMTRAFPDAAVMVGISMGAAVALELAAERDLEALVLIRPAWRWEPSPSNLAVYPYLADLLESMSPNDAADALRDSRYFADIAQVSLAAAQALLAQLAAPDAVRRATRLRSIPASAPTRPARTPRTLVLGCEGDPVHPLELARWLADDIGASLLAVPARYDSPREHRDAIVAAVTRFLREV
jgi:pimeloyl-ACP methyl ester carboxylesterase